MAEDRRAQLELWRQERLREKRPVQTTTVAVQRRVVVASRATSATGATAAKSSGRGPRATAATASSAAASRATVNNNSTATRAPTAAARRPTAAVATSTSATRTSTTGSATGSATGSIASDVASRRVSAGGSSSRNTSLDSAASGDNDDDGSADATMAAPPASGEQKPRKEKRRTSFILPSPSKMASLAGGAKRVLTPTRLSPPKTTGDADAYDDAAGSGTATTLATASAVLARMDESDDDESDGGFGPSPRRKKTKRAVSGGHAPRHVATTLPIVSVPDTDDARESELPKMFDDGETDADAQSVRTTLSFGAVSGPLRVLHAELASDEDDASEFGVSRVDPNAIEDKHEVPLLRPATETASSVFVSLADRSEACASDAAANATRTGAAPQRAMRVLTSSGSGLGPPLRTSVGESTSRRSLDETRAALTLEERLEQRRNWEMEDFVVTKNLGKGKFGNVYLAKEKHSNVSVALKVLYKSPLILEGGLKNLQREVEIQHRLLHPNLLRLFGYFYDESCVYLILEFASHGELYKLLSKQRCFSEAFAAHYIAQVVDALEYLHGCQVIHRDIKPENLLMGPNHTIKLADFGWSVHAPQQFAKRRTFCGTPDYLSPEVLLCQEYDHRVDVWSVGVLAFEFLFGATPFHVDNQMEMYKRIENVDFHFPSEPAVSDSAKNFIMSLLKRNPADRMTLADAKQHEWLAQRPSI